MNAWLIGGAIPGIGLLITLAVVFLVVPKGDRGRYTDGIGNKMKEASGKAKEVGAISLLIVFINWLCCLFKFDWWFAVFHLGAAFWVANIAIIVTTVVIWSIEKKAVRFMAFLIFTIIIVGCVKAVMEPERDLKAGRWTTFEVPDGKEIRINTEYGVKFQYIVNEETEPRESGPNGEFAMVEGRLAKISIKPSRDMTAKIKYSKIGN